MSKRSLLILDDDEAVGQTIQWIAETLDFYAEFVTNADDFFAKMKSLCPDFITIDLVMPGLDGVEIMRLLAETRCTARIVISSGMGHRVLDAAQRSAAEHGLQIAGVLPKPITRDALRALIGEGTQSVNPAAVQSRSTGGAAFEVTAAQLREALDRREFIVAYQPKVVCRSGVPAGFEALVRWNHPQRGVIPPDRFIPVAEQAGLIDELTTQVFDQAFAWFASAFPGGALTLSLNLSARSLVDLHLVEYLAQLCAQFHIAAGRIALELTESSAMVDSVVSLDLLTRLRVKGFHLSIDDFGTGFSSMLQLVRLPFSEIKVDKSFVLRARQSEESRSVIKSIVDLGHSLGLTVTAEGVEDQEALEYLNSIGCDLAQGYLFARPMPGDAAQAWTTQHLPL
jgi:EAL domain-containing protein (putative c-di-GMP-specific phosphodiesterase class I)/ActR/RegA family two-component response regulator